MSKCICAVAYSVLSRRLHFGKSNVVAIGDGLNDIGMLSNAGLGIAMANAKAEIQAVADQVTGPIGGGVADAINGLLSSR